MNNKKTTTSVVTDQSTTINRAINYNHCIEIDDTTYAKLAVKLSEAIGSSSFFNGIIDFDRNNIYSTFTATVIVYHTDTTYPEGTSRAISDIVPIWWEYSTAIKAQGEVINDFCWDTFKTTFLAL